MINSDKIKSLIPFLERTIELKIFDETDQDFLSRVKRVFNDTCFFKVSLSDGDYSLAETDQLIFGEHSLLFTQIRLGEPYTKDSGAMDVNGIKNEFIINYNDIKKISSGAAGKKDYIEFKLLNGNIITSLGIPTNTKISDLADKLHKILL